MMKTWQIFVYLAVIIAVVMALLVLTFTNVTPSVSNYYQQGYAQVTHQILPKIQVGYFINDYFPISNNVTLSAYSAMLNGTFKPQLASLNRYVATTGLQAFPITTTTEIGGNLITPYVLSLSQLIYSDNPSNFPTTNSTAFDYVFPIYEVQYTVSCSNLTQAQQAQILNINSTMLKYFGTCNANRTNKFTYQALVGVSNKTATRIDNLYSLMNPSYIVGSQNFLQPLTVYNKNGTIASTNNAINGTLLGYVASSASTYKILNLSNRVQAIKPIRNIYKGDAYSGTVLLAGLYCWNSKYSTLTNYLQTAHYSQYPYLYEYIYNHSTYLCLTLNATNILLNATSNIDGSNFKMNPKVLNGTLLKSFPDYIIANKTAIADTYQYLTSGIASTVSETATKPYWFMPNTTKIFSLAKAPSYVFTELTATQYLLSSTFPVFGEEPNYTVIPVNTTYGTLSIVQQAVINNATTYLYAPLIKNLTYQYTWNTTKNGTLVYCASLCDYNGTLVYAQYGYPYEYANPDFGFYEIPRLNQTLFYDPQIAIIAQTPFSNDTNVQNTTYGKNCLVKDKYTCIYGESPSQIFDSAKNYSAFVIYGESNSSRFLINGYNITGWAHLESYISSIELTNKIVTISLLNDQGQNQWTVSGSLETMNKAQIIVVPQDFVVNQGTYPSAYPLNYSLTSIIIFAGAIVLVGVVSYNIAKTKLSIFDGEE